MKKEQPNSPEPFEEFPETASPESATSEDVVFTPASSCPTEPEAPFGINYTVVADRILSFLSTATPEQLAATIAGGTIMLYALLGTVGLMLVGVLLGIVLYASLENWRSPGLMPRGTSEFMAGWLEKMREQECNGEDAEGGEMAIRRGKSASRHPGPVDFSSLSPETAAAFTELTDAIIRDYVRWWYSPILPNDDNFPSSCRQLLTQTLLKMHARISRKRPTDTFLLFLISTSNTFIVLLRELAQTSQTSIGMYIEESPSSALAQLVDRDSQRQKLRMAADNILQTFLPSEALDSELVRTFLTQILAGVVLEKTVEKCSSADFINGWIIYLLEPETQPEVLQKFDIGEATSGAVEEAGAATVEEQERKRQSKAEEEMEKAMKEAQELSKMIAEDEARASMSSSEFGSAATSSNVITKNHLIESPLDGTGSDFPSITQRVPEDLVVERGETPPPQLLARPAAFTSFDQIVPPAEPQDMLFCAHVELSDLTPTNPGTSAEKPLRSKPAAAIYLLQIEPSSSSIPGWILTRKFADFESLHEVLIRLSKISGVVEYSELPAWKGQTSESLRSQLERFLNKALKIQILAECEGMKRFLEKDASTMGAMSRSPGGAFAGLGKGWPNSQALAKVGGGVLGVLSKAPQGAAESGKALFGGVFRGGVGIKRISSSNLPENGGGTQGPQDGLPAARGSVESLRPSQRERSRSLVTTSEEATTDDGTTEAERQKPELPPRLISTDVEDQKPLLPSGRPTSLRQSLQPEIPWDDGELLNLPPPPSDMPDDYDRDLDPGALPRKRSGSAASSLLPNPRSLSLNSGVANPTSTQTPTPSSTPPPPPLDPPRKKHFLPLSTAEAQFVVEIIFAIISELYTLSSAWIFRRSLLNVAKSILLRPGNASLESIRVLIQETVIASNTTDSAVSEYVRKLRESAFPTTAELEAWGPAATPAEQEARRDKARDLVRERGLPEALRGVMGNVASAECCSVMFDALQEEPVARGVVCGIVLDAVRGFCE